jgi:hypothetical protein
MSSLNIIAGGKGLKAGQELTFFYPSTEWDMDQGFDCFCGSENCLGYIGGAKNMTPAQLEVCFLCHCLFIPPITCPLSPVPIPPSSRPSSLPVCFQFTPPVSLTLLLLTNIFTPFQCFKCFTEP